MRIGSPLPVLKRPAGSRKWAGVSAAVLLASLCLRGNAVSGLWIQKRQSDFLSRFALVRLPDFLYVCDPDGPDPDAIALVPPGCSVETGEIFFILDPARKVVPATWTGPIDSCRPLFSSQAVPMGALRLDRHLSAQDGLFPAFLSVRGFEPSLDRIGSVAPAPELTAREYAGRVRRLMPGGGSIQQVVRLRLPGSGKAYDFVEASAQGPDGPATDEARVTGFLYSRDGSAPLVREEGLSEILSVSDLNRDGVYEVLVYVGADGCCGRFELRLFNGRKFLKERRVLYAWSQ